MKLKLLTAAMLAMAIAPMSANALQVAQTTTRSLTVLATVVTPPVIISPLSSLNFGNVPTGSSARRATTSFDVTVRQGTPYSISFGGGLNSGGTTAFTMKSRTGGNNLNYLLFKDSTLAVSYPANAVGASITGQSGTGIAQTYTLFARTALAGAAGNYTDTITITVTY